MIKFISALLIAAVSVVGVSLLWPRFTSEPRPVILTQVKDFVIQTPQGYEAANVLGVSDERNVEPFDIRVTAENIAFNIMNTLKKRATDVVVTQAVRQLQKKYEELPPDQQQQLQQIICVPADAGPAASESSESTPAETPAEELPQESTEEL